MKIKEAMESIGKEISYNVPIINEYEQILQRKKRSFEFGTWAQPNAHYYAETVLRYLIEEKLSFTFEELISVKTYDFKNKWKLNGLLKYVYNDSFQDAVLEIYGLWINPWDFKRSHRYLSDDETIENWLMEFAEEFLHFETKEEIITFFSVPNLKKNHGKVFRYFNSSPYKVYRYFYPKGEIKPYEFKIGHNHLWEDKEIVNQYLSDLFRKEGIVTKKEFLDFISSTKFRSKTKGLYRKFNNSPWNLYLYLKKEKMLAFDVSIFDLKVVPNGFYQNDLNKKKALEWLIYEKLNITSKEEYIEKLSMKKVDKYIRGLSIYLSDFESIHQFIVKNKIIDWEILPWEHRYRSSVIWENQSIREEAICWFFEKYLKLKPFEVNMNAFKVKDIWDARLKELYQPYFSQKYENAKEVWVQTYYKIRNIGQL